MDVANATDHTIIVHGRDRMALRETNGVAEHAIARRQDGIWYVSADGVPEGQTTDLHRAIEMLTEHTQLKLNGTLAAEGFSTFVPHEARKLHGKEHFDKWKASVGLHGLEF